MHSLRGVLLEILLKFRPIIGRRFDKAYMKLDKIRFFKKLGMKIGSNCRIQTNFLCSEPYLISMGDNVHLGDNVQLITHDGAVWVLRNLCNNHDLDLFGRITICDNVFIGNNAIILPNTSIGSNSIVGAGAVVTKDIPSGVIFAGIPAKCVGTVEAYKSKNLDRCLLTKRLRDNSKRKAIMDSLGSET